MVQIIQRSRLTSCSATASSSSGPSGGCRREEPSAPGAVAGVAGVSHLHQQRPGRFHAEHEGEFVLTLRIPLSFVDYYDGLPEQWGTWDELNNTEVATEMTRDRLTARQLATLGGVDYCGLRPGDLAPFEKALHGDDGTRMWGVASVLRRLLLVHWLYMVGLRLLLLLVLAALGIFPGTFFVAPFLGDHCCGNFRDNFLTTF